MTKTSPPPAMAAANGKLPPGIPPKPEIEIGWRWVAPEDASGMMDRNYDRNRALRRTWVDYLAHTMVEETFYPTHQGIAFDEDGQLIDGQHRLEAIRKSGRGQWLLVATGIPRSAVLAMDRHARRRESDQIRVATDDLFPTYHDVSIARAMHLGFRADPTVRLDGQELVDFLRARGAAIAFAQRHFSSSGYHRNAMVRGAIAKAFYHADHDRLDEFMVILNSGLTNGPQDLGAIRVRDLVGRGVSNSGVARRDLIRKTCAALVYFLDHKPISKLYAIAEDPFPLPEL
jgi:hypothetical protein